MAFTDNEADRPPSLLRGDVGDEPFRRLADAHPHGILLHDRSGRLVWWNAAASRLLGIGAHGHEGNQDGLEPRIHFYFADGSPLSADQHPARVTLETRTNLTSSLFQVQLEGEERRRWLSASTSRLEGAGGEDSGVVTALVEVTESHAIHEEAETLSLVARRTADAVIICDGEGRVTWVNDAFTRQFGWTTREVAGTRLDELLKGPETNPETIEKVSHALCAGQAFGGEMLTCKRDGTGVWLDLAISIVRDEKSGVSHQIAIARDVSARRASARTLFQLSSAISATEEGIAVIDASHQFTFANDAFAEQFGFNAGGNLVGREWGSLFDAQDATRFTDVIFRNLWTGDRWRGEVTGARRGGSPFPVEISVTLLPGDSMVAVARDITERRRRDAEQQRLSAILEATPDLVAISDLGGNLLYMNAAGRRLLGVAPIERVRLDQFYTDAAIATTNTVGIPVADRMGVWSGEGELKLRDGRAVPVSQVIVSHQQRDGGVEFHSTIMRDITERKEAEEALRKMSLHDQLTGLHNRRGFLLLAQQALATASRTPGHCILLYFDLNDFKPINDTYGHQAGDAALQETAEILGETFRESDITGRLGGDEFVALAVNCHDPSGGILLQRLDERLSVHNEKPDRLFRLSMGRGIARFNPENPQTLQQLLDEADAKLYEDKRVRKAARATARLVQQVESD